MNTRYPVSFIQDAVVMLLWRRSIEAREREKAREVPSNAHIVLFTEACDLARLFQVHVHTIDAMVADIIKDARLRRVTLVDRVMKSVELAGSASRAVGVQFIACLAENGFLAYIEELAQVLQYELGQKEVLLLRKYYLSHPPESVAVKEEIYRFVERYSPEDYAETFRLFNSGKHRKTA